MSQSTTTSAPATGWAALPILRDADAAYVRGDVATRNALLRTVDPTMWNGRELLPEPQAATISRTRQSLGSKLAAELDRGQDAGLLTWTTEVRDGMLVYVVHLTASLTGQPMVLSPGVCADWLGIAR